MNARTRHAPLLTLAFGAFAVAAAAVWGPYAQLLRVADDGGGSGLRLVVAELESPLKAKKSSAPALKPAVNSEGDTPAAPRASRQVLDTPGHTPHLDGGAINLAAPCAQVSVADTGPPQGPSMGFTHNRAFAPVQQHAARGPPSA